MQSEDEDPVDDAYRAGRQGNAKQARAALAEFDKDPAKLVALAYSLGHEFGRNRHRRGELESTVLDRVAWLIRQHPASRLTFLVASDLGMVGTESQTRLRSEWLTVLDRNPQDPHVFANAASFFDMHEPERAQALHRRVLALDPLNIPAALSLATSITLSHTSMDHHDLDAVQAVEAKAREMVTLLEGMLAAFGDQRDSSLVLSALADVAALANEWDKVATAAQQLLECELKHALGWMRGNAIYQGNTWLGRAALRRGDVAEAKSRLLAAGRTCGSPQLDSFGPEMALAQDLLERGERDVVLQFLELCRAFWRMDEGYLDTWSKMIREGGVPTLNRFAFD
jgi:hypothetical protein